MVKNNLILMTVIVDIDSPLLSFMYINECHVVCNVKSMSGPDIYVYLLVLNPKPRPGLFTLVDW